MTLRDVTLDGGPFDGKQVKISMYVLHMLDQDSKDHMQPLKVHVYESVSPTSMRWRGFRMM